MTSRTVRHLFLLCGIRYTNFVIADDIPGIADFASDLDEDDEDEDDEDEDDEEDGGAEDVGGSRQDVDSQPPSASKKGKSSAQQKSKPKLPPKKGTAFSSALFAKFQSNHCLIYSSLQAAELALKLNTRLKRRAHMSITINKMVLSTHEVSCK